MNVITGLERMSLTGIYDPAIDKSSIGAVQIRDHYLAVITHRQRTVHSGHARVIEPDSAAGRPACVLGRPTPDQIEPVLAAVLYHEYQAARGRSRTALSQVGSLLHWRGCAASFEGVALPVLRGG